MWADWLIFSPTLWKKTTKPQSDVVMWHYTTYAEAIVWYKALLEGESASRCDTQGDLEICLAEEQRAGRKCRRHTEQKKTFSNTTAKHTLLQSAALTEWVTEFCCLLVTDFINGCWMSHCNIPPLMVAIFFHIEMSTLYESLFCHLPVCLVFK